MTSASSAFCGQSARSSACTPSQPERASQRATYILVDLADFGNHAVDPVRHLLRAFAGCLAVGAPTSGVREGPYSGYSGSHWRSTRSMTHPSFQISHPGCFWRISFVNMPSYAPYAHSPTSGSVVKDDLGGRFSPNSYGRRQPHLACRTKEPGQRKDDVPKRPSFGLVVEVTPGYVEFGPVGSGLRLGQYTTWPKTMASIRSTHDPRQSSCRACR
ncbi:hypothetical protein VNO80_33231 [Phaseolus coccineus]|uniref:Uncharacterized protein n=1 Tax=Phaseolus coccineus TaxID=3886 RepID=A0AAN9L038_PHACN